MVLVQPDEVWFHDSTLVDVQAVGSRITLKLVDGRTRNDLPCSITIILEGITLLKADGEVAGTLMMEGDDAEILSLDRHENGIAVLLEWNDWKRRRQFVRSYEIKAQDVRVIIAD